MAKTSPNRQWQYSVVLLSGTVILAAVVGTLYWAQIVFVPMALSILMTFLLTPPVRWLERKGFRRTPAIMVVVLLSVSVVGELGWLITQQMTSLARELPDYSANVQKKIHSIREMSAGWERFQTMVDDVSAAVLPKEVVQGGPGEPPTVVVRPESGWLGRWPHFVGSAAEFMAGAALVFVLTVFGLFKREDLRNRFLRLIGPRRLTFTTKAVDEAGERVSRYLITQAGVNAAYGMALAAGLGIVGVKYALLWGFVAAVLRYVPYLGAWLSMLFPLATSIATADTWGEPLAAFGVFIALEMLTYNVVEPLLYKRSMGVSEVAQLVSAAFWGFLWGPIGLVLSAPLTVCLLVIGKYVPQLNFLDVLLGDEPPLEPAVSLYQRLLAWDDDDASQLLTAQLKEAPAEEAFDALLIPALNFTKRDRIRDEITDEDEEFILRSLREMADDIVPATTPKPPHPSRVRILACPSFDGSDVLALEMLQKLINPERWEMEIVRPDALASEVVERAVSENYTVICIGSIPPGGSAHTRYLCKRLRSRLPNVKIVVGRWGRKSNDENQRQLIEAGADGVDATLLDTRNQLNTWLPVLAQPAAPESKNQTVPLAASATTDLRQALAAV